MSEHSLISPSNLHRILGSTPCYASVLKAKDIPEPPAGDAALLGTELHEQAENHLLAGTDSDNELVQGYLEYVRSLIKGGVVRAEMRVSLSDYCPDMFGTADAVVISGNNELHVVDLKTGSHPVMAENNPQLLAYALGVIDAMVGDFWGIYLHIYQPGNISTTKVTKSELYAFGDYLRDATERALTPNEFYGVSESNCKYCKYAPQCPALHAHSLEVVGGDFEVLPPADSLTDEQLVTVITHKKQVEQWLGKVEKHALQRLNSGDHIDGLKVVAARSQRRWGPEAEAELEAVLGDRAYNKKLIGLGEAEKLLGKTTVSELAVKPPVVPQVALATDKREALVLTVEEFDKLD